MDVEGPYRQQRLAVAGPGRAQLGQQPGQVDLRDAQLYVLALLGLSPMHEGGPVLGEPVRVLVEVPGAYLVDPASQVRRRSNVGADGHHSCRGGRSSPVDVDQEPAQCLLGGLPSLTSTAQVNGQVHGGARRGDGPGEAKGGGGAHPALRAVLAEVGPGVVGVGAELGAEKAPLVV